MNSRAVLDAVSLQPRHPLRRAPLTTSSPLAFGYRNAAKPPPRGSSKGRFATNRNIRRGLVAAIAGTELVFAIATSANLYSQIANLYSPYSQAAKAQRARGVRRIAYRACSRDSAAFTHRPRNPVIFFFHGFRGAASEPFPSKV